MFSLIHLVFLGSFTASWAGEYPEDLEYYRQPDDVGEYYHFAPLNDSRSCTRECTANTPPRLCYYRFVLEDYATMSQACENCPHNPEKCTNPQCITADGYERGIVVVNRRLPGPSIQVCLGDRIVVDVINQMPARSTTIHWHGLFQKGTPYADGVPMVTQCPILEANGYRYDFYASQPGTFFWHSHDGIQRVDGLQGSLIIRRPEEEDPNSFLYDHDLPAHVMVLMDWFHTDAPQHFPGLLRPFNPLDRTYYLINGKGRFHNPDGKIDKTPYSIFRVKQGKSYRFRIIGALCTHCPARFSIEGHRLTLIATDANAVEPVTVDYLEIYTGERYDFVLDAQKDVGSYWISLSGLSSCQSNYTYQLAILQYEGSNQFEPGTPAPIENLAASQGLGLNIQNATCGEGDNGVCVDMLEAAEDFNPVVLRPEPNITIPLEFGYFFPGTKREFQSNTFHRYHHPEPNSYIVIYEVNKIYNMHPPSPVLSQRHDIPSDTFCKNGPDGLTTCFQDLCSCFNVMRIPKGALVQLILIDNSIGGGINHPFHLHGNAFNVMAMGYLEPEMNSVYRISQRMKEGTLTVSPKPVIKDTIAVPSSGYAVLRFVADNPGYWLFHCHFVYHHEVGMSVLFQVGEPEDFPPPPRGYPKCGNYFPPLSKRSENRTTWYYEKQRGLF